MISGQEYACKLTMAGDRRRSGHDDAGGAQCDDSYHTAIHLQPDRISPLLCHLQLMLLRSPSTLLLLVCEMSLYVL